MNRFQFFSIIRTKKAYHSLLDQMIEMFIKTTRWLDERMAQFSWGQIESEGSWPVDLKKIKKIVQSMEHPWASIHYSERLLPSTEEILHTVSKRMTASQILDFVNDTLCRWECANALEEIPFRVVVRRGCGFTSLHFTGLNRKSMNNEFLIRLIISDKKRFI